MNNPRAERAARQNWRVELNQPTNSYLDGHVDIKKSFLEILLLHPAGNVAEMQGG